MSTDDEAAPRGLTEQGLVRTTGWLQAGSETISSGLVTTIICLLLALVTALALLPLAPVASGLVVFLLPIGGYGCWHLVTTRLAPASTAHNIDVVPAALLEAGTWVRLYGTIGPVGEVTLVEPSTSDDVVEVTFNGGTTLTWPAEHEIHTVVLDD